MLKTWPSLDGQVFMSRTSNRVPPGIGWFGPRITNALEEEPVFQDTQYAVQSLELHLFFARIMKEHALFLEAGFTPVDADFAREADRFKREFEGVLRQALTLGEGIVRPATVRSGEFVTEFTARAERQTQRFTGIAIDQSLTARALGLRGGEVCRLQPELFRRVRALNGRALRLLDGLIALKERTLDRVLSCQMFTMNYPLLIEHILREAQLYRDYVRRLEDCGQLDCQSMREVERFWNQIMMEHAMFIRGLLDPTENQLIETADSFAKDYARLLADSCAAQDRAMAADSLGETIKFRDFKAAGAQGIGDCKIRSVILPLLADHVLREANHYIRLLDG